MFWILLFITFWFFFLYISEWKTRKKYKEFTDTLKAIGLFIIVSILFSLPGVLIIYSFDSLPDVLSILLIFIISIVFWVPLFKISRWYSKKKSDYNFKTKYGKTKSEQEAIEKFQKNRREYD